MNSIVYSLYSYRLEICDLKNSKNGIKMNSSRLLGQKFVTLCCRVSENELFWRHTRPNIFMRDPNSPRSCWFFKGFRRTVVGHCQFQSGLHKAHDNPLVIDRNATQNLCSRQGVGNCNRRALPCHWLNPYFYIFFFSIASDPQSCVILFFFCF